MRTYKVRKFANGKNSRGEPFMTLKTGGRGRDRKPRKKRASRPKKTARSHPST